MSAKEVAEWIMDKAASVEPGDDPVHCVLPGGSTPRPIYSALARTLTSDINMTFSLTDERCVPADEARRNETPLTMAVGVSRVTSLLEQDHLVPRAAAPAPHIALVGLGLDGHVASLFPGSRALAAAERGDGRALVSVDDAPDGVARVSRTFAGLTGRIATAIVFSGADKRGLLQRVLQGKSEDLPVARMFLRVPDIKVLELK